MSPLKDVPLTITSRQSQSYTRFECSESRPSPVGERDLYTSDLGLLYCPVPSFGPRERVRTEDPLTDEFSVDSVFTLNLSGDNAWSSGLRPLSIQTVEDRD